MAIFNTVLDYLNKEKTEFLHQVNIKKTKENTKDSIGKALKTDS